MDDRSAEITVVRDGAAGRHRKACHAVVAAVYGWQADVLLAPSNSVQFYWYVFFIERALVVCMKIRGSSMRGRAKIGLFSYRQT